MSVIQSIWSPPHHATTTQRDGAPTDHISNNNAPQTQVHSHHFHFPPISLLAATTSFRQHLRAEGHKLAHAADGERGLPPSGRSGTGSVSSWSPPTDIRQTRLAYHIEIEVPGTTNKEELLIQWLSPSTLIVRGETERPFVGHGKAAEGAFQFERGEEGGGGDGYANGGTGSVGSAVLEQEPRAQDGTHGHDVGGGGLCIQDGPPRQLERQTSLKQNEHDGRHVPSGFTYQTSTGSKHLGDDSDNTTQDGGVLKRMITDPGDECADIPMFLLEERKTGPWQRTFTLPHDIEMKALRARLEGGLLRIDIPTKDVSAKPGVRVEIE